MRLYHLLPAKWGLEAIANKRIKVSRFADLNDPFELVGAKLHPKSRRAEFHRWKDEISTTYGLLCFSKSWKSPVLWSHYGERHSGLCLGFDVSDDSVVPVRYERERVEVDPERLDPCAMNDLLSRKFDEWNYETEVRVIKKLSELKLENELYFANFSNDLVLRDVVVGALSAVSRKCLEGKIQNAGYCLSMIKLTKARLAFKSYKIVTDQRGLQ